MRRLLAATVVILLALPSAAVAKYADGADLVSVSYSRLEQGDADSADPAMSADGRYVVFDTTSRNFFADDDPDPPHEYRAGGLFRRDMQTNALELVADGDVHDEDSDRIIQLGAHEPSVSADGRYVAFSTDQQLVPSDTDDDIDVYVRDMTVPIRDPDAYTLVSATTATATPSTHATYATPPHPVVGQNPGTDTWGGHSISADGRKVVFRTDADSNLPLGGPGTATPAGQLFVRDLDAKTTTLITRDRSTGQPAGGATEAMAISADGSTVAWPGLNAAEQTPFMRGELSSDSIPFYLWQRIGEPTRRITGVADLDDPGCDTSGTLPSSQTQQGPCFGPLTDPEGYNGDLASFAPGLSADGYKVAFLVTSGPRPLTSTGYGPDVWITDMHPGVSRKAGSRELTRDATGSDPLTSAPIASAELSADGNRIALVTQRTSWILRTPSPTGTFRSSLTARDVDVIDLQADTIERVTRATDGGDTDGDIVGGTSMSSDGSKIAFGSRATNLFFGDANGHPDVFMAQVAVDPPPEPPAPDPDDTAPPAQDITPVIPRLGVKQRRNKDGSVDVTVIVPAAGVVEVSTKGRIAGTAKEARKSRRKLPLRVVATGRTIAKAQGTVAVKLKLASRYRADLGRRHSIRTSAKFVFRPSSGGAQIHRSAAVVFVLARK